MATGRLPDPNSAPVTAKGDLYTYSTVPAKLAVGNNGETLVADSSQTTGLRYNPPVGSLGNPVINGGMDVWQRGTSVSVSASTSPYTADRWQVSVGANQASTVARQTTSDTTNLPNIQYSARVQRNSGQTGTGTISLNHTLESTNSIPFAGKTVTLSFYARAGANFSASGSTLFSPLVSGTGTDQNYVSGFTGSATVANVGNTLTTSWQRFVVSGTVSTSATQLAVQFSYTPVGTAGANDWFEVTGVQLDVGTWTASTAPTFRRSGGTLAGELAACQRYYYRVTTPTSNYGAMGLWGIQSTTTTGVMIGKNPVTMRVEPTSIEYSSLAVSDSSGTESITALTINSDRTNADMISCDSTNSGALTQYRYSYIRANNSSSAYFGVSAEL